MSVSAAGRGSRPVAKATRLARVAGRMNALERAYSAQLDLLVRAGRVAEWHFEALTLRIGADCTYRPDFLVILPDGSIEFHETKGWLRDDARVKLRAAASAFPFVFKLVTRAKGEWRIEEVPA